MRAYQRFMIFGTMLILGIFVLPMAKSTIQASNTPSVESDAQHDPVRSHNNLVVNGKSHDLRRDSLLNENRWIGDVQVTVEDGEQIAHVQAEEFSIEQDQDNKTKAIHVTSGTLSVDGIRIEVTDLTLRGSNPFLFVTFLQAYFRQDPDLLDFSFTSDDLHFDGETTTFTTTSITPQKPGYITLNGLPFPFEFQAEKVIVQHEPQDILWNSSKKGARIDGNPLKLTLSGRTSLTLGDMSLEGTDITVHYPPRPSEETSLTFVSPLKKGRVSAEFGFMPDPFTQKERFHRGIDIAVQIGTDIYTVADGTVLSIPEEDDGYGKNLIIQHGDGFTSRYAKLSNILVQEGHIVKAGEKIAVSGNTGVSTGPHLHFKLQRYDTHRNPTEWIDFSAFGAASGR